MSSKNSYQKINSEEKKSEITPKTISNRIFSKKKKF